MRILFGGLFGRYIAGTTFFKTEAAVTRKTIESKILRRSDLDNSLTSEVTDRDASLWVGAGIGEADADRDAIARLVALPWQAAAVESSSAELAAGIRALSQLEPLVATRGFIDLIGADPQTLSLPARTLPVYLLNGRQESSDPAESSHLKGTLGLQRRLNMLSCLRLATPKHLVLLSDASSSVVDEFAGVWASGLRARITLVTSEEAEIERFVETLSELSPMPAATVVFLDPAIFAERLSEAVLRTVSPETLTVTTRQSDGSKLLVDASTCDLPAAPILDRYELLSAREVEPRLPEDLASEELDAFFRRSSTERVWRAHAAGLPWFKDDLCRRQLLNRLRRLQAKGEPQERANLVVAESGAGGTTMMEHLAFAAAEEGFPTLVARRLSFEPDATELVSFLNRFLKAHDAARASASSTGSSAETPFLLAFDAEHWRGRESLIGAFIKKFERSGRSVVVLVVTDIDGLNRVPAALAAVLETDLVHNMTTDAAADLGRHLNRYLAVNNNDRPESEWKRFYDSQQPAIGDFGATPVSFWIALEFWLRNEVSMTESIQSWLYGAFRTADLEDDLRRTILQIAAMSIERLGLPEELVPAPANDPLPRSMRLEEASDLIPALGLARRKSASGRQWMCGHPLLARYLIAAVASDRKATLEHGLPDNLTTVQLRLELLSTVASSQVLGTERYLPLAVYFATTVLKLDRDGNREFFLEWRRVLAILESVHPRVWQCSRAFNHHVAISRRRIVSDEEFFPLSLDEKREQLTAAAEHLVYAIEEIGEVDNDDSTLNLLNSLARCYQDLRDLYGDALSDPERASEYRDLAARTTLRAFELSPLNSYVLETRARELIFLAREQAADAPQSAASSVCQAVDAIQRALSLDSAPERETRLHELLGHAFELLHNPAVTKQLAQLRSQGDPFGLVGCAWLELRNHLQPDESLVLEDVDDRQVDSALELLEGIDPTRRTPVDLRLRYELVVRRHPRDYTTQLELLEEIAELGAGVDHQNKLELAILFYQVGRPGDGGDEFSRLRTELKQSDAYVIVPDRLKVLAGPKGNALVCQASFVRIDNYGKHWAKVQELGRATAPFIPADFGKTHMQPRERFQCIVTFGPNGPFLRPAGLGA